MLMLVEIRNEQIAENVHIISHSHETFRALAAINNLTRNVNDSVFYLNLKFILLVLIKYKLSFF